MSYTDGAMLSMKLFFRKSRTSRLLKAIKNTKVNIKPLVLTEH